MYYYLSLSKIHHFAESHFDFLSFSFATFCIDLISLNVFLSGVCKKSVSVNEVVEHWLVVNIITLNGNWNVNKYCYDITITSMKLEYIPVIYYSLYNNQEVLNMM
jgi:hypothetical protein